MLTTLAISSILLLGVATSVSALNDSPTETATFAGGCFWCMEPPFEKLDGVISVVSGYTGGHTKDPTYEEVTSGTTGHTETVVITFDPRHITYAELVEVFWQQIDPTDKDGQFADRGSSYRSAIFYHTPEQKRIAEESKMKLESSKRFSAPIVTEIQQADDFFEAEAYHQDYYKNNPVRYKLYRYGSGRDTFLEKNWATKGKDMNAQGSQMDTPSKQEIKKMLTPLQFRVTQKNGTEKPFANEYWDNKNDGIYVDIVSGEALFSSTEKFKSGTGWPSFTAPLNSENIVERTDRSIFMVRTEVRSRLADSHLGHLFEDGPLPTGLRYCINSASLRFVPKEKLEQEGYGKYLPLFKE